MEPSSTASRALDTGGFGPPAAGRRDTPGARRDGAPARAAASGPSPGAAAPAAPVPADRPGVPRRWRRWAADWATRLAALALGIAAWQFAASHALHLYVRFDNVPAPLDVAAAWYAHLADADFYRHILASLRRIAISYSLATLIGIALGVAMGRSRAVTNIARPYIEILRPIPAVAWIPLAILMWPTEEGSIIFITFLGALFPIVLNTVHGVGQTPEVLVRAARSLGASDLAVFRHIVLPAAFPSIRAGMVIGMGVSWFSLLAGEIISGQYGIGYFTWNAYSVIDYQDIIVGMLMIGLLGTASSHLVLVATAPLLAWQKRSNR